MACHCLAPSIATGPTRTILALAGTWRCGLVQLGGPLLRSARSTRPKSNAPQA
jgi:hypothetical protein